MRLLPCTILLFALASGLATADEAAFPACLTDIQARASELELSESTVKTVIPQLEFQPRVIELDRSQPEFTSSFADYFSRRVSPARIEKGRNLYLEHAAFLADLTRRYDVPGQYLVAFWGLETNYGSYLGNTPTLDALATLACDGRRGEYFTTELLVALQLLEEHRLQPDAMRGSWAGAMGHTQFMPSNYARYAIDGDGDGRIDLWGSPRDALASAAAFLAQIGWVRQQRWGREVRLPQAFPSSQLGEQRELNEWREQGLRRADGGPLPVVAGMQAELIVPAGHQGPAFLVYENFEVIRRWNRSNSYALSVGHLADRITGAGGLVQAPPADQPRLHRTQVVQLQETLAARGFDSGEPDGIIGPATRSALLAFQLQAGLVGDGFPDRGTLQRLGVAAE